MYATAQSLGEHLIDYAGLFPPAKLTMPDAVRHYARFLRGPERWLLARFVCPTARLGELLAEARTAGLSDELRIAALGQATTTFDEFTAQLQRDVAVVEAFRHAWGRADAVDVLETPIPVADVNGHRVIDGARIVGEAGLRGFFEVPAAALGSDAVEALCSQLRGHGLKLRTGGLTAQAYPSEEQIAAFIVLCRRHALPWKATAGLHHPLRQRDAATGALMHGFLNVFGAGVLARVHPSLGEADLTAILRDANGAGFWFEDQRFGWNDWACSLDELREIRRRWLPSFGSCSIEEPFADLAALDMIDPKQERAKKSGP